MKASEVSISELKTQVASLVVDNKTLGEDVDAANHKAATLEKEIAAIKLEKFKMREESNRIEAELRRERDQAQDQISLFLNKTENEKSELQSKEQKLVQSLNQTMDQLNRKEDECEDNLRRIKELQVEKEAMAEAARDLRAQFEQLTQNYARVEEERLAKCKEIESLKTKLEGCNTTIQQVKAELSKAIDKINANDTLIKRLESDKQQLEFDLKATVDDLTKKEELLTNAKNNLLQQQN